MKKFLEKIKLIDFLDTELEIQKNDFIYRLNKIVDEGSTNSLFDFFDGFSSSKNEYKGNVKFSTFEIKRKRKFFDMNFNFPAAKGILNQKGDFLNIKIEINAFKGIMLVFFIFLLIFYSIFIVMMLIGADESNGSSFIAIPFILLHATFMMGFPYMIMRRSVKRFKYEFERELFYLTKK